MFFWIFILFIWNFLGGFAVWAIADWNFLELNIMNPYRVYQSNSTVNWFGATMISLLCAILFPIGALCYWFYFLCVVGRK
jgi:hypothetical protein